ncbi:hypothetical protein SAY87_032352 [Trapa incisa]|uniref:Uncharacterized protein n=1 Tax=Trapa incisa TaxID=236973 RepID=A0AAN7G989_9MYRT|nr:hypothetical protein SAY87_032352 [Trapa incisa]
MNSYPSAAEFDRILFEEEKNEEEEEDIDVRSESTIGGGDMIRETQREEAGADGETEKPSNRRFGPSSDDDHQGRLYFVLLINQVSPFQH